MRHREFIDTLVKEVAARKDADDADVAVANNSTSSRLEELGHKEKRRRKVHVHCEFARER